MAIKICHDDLIFFVLKLFTLPTSMDYICTCIKSIGMNNASCNVATFLQNVNFIISN